MNAQEFGAQIHGVKRAGQEFTGQCPAHQDRRASLSWRDGDKGTVVTCFAGCTVEAITGALGLTPASLFFEPRMQSASSASKIISARYPYTDEHGTVLYEVVRYQPKDFRQRKPDGKGGWTWTLNGVRRVLYRTPDLIGKPEVWIVEGERDADRLAARGLAATTQAGGAGKWNPEFSAWLKANGIKRVMVLPDNDPPGDAHGLAVAQACLDAGLDVRLLRLPGLPPKGDVSDWLDAGHTIEDLQRLATQAPPFKGVLCVVEGDTYRYAWPHLDIAVRIEHVTSRSAGLHGEITVTMASRHLHWAQLNLSSSPARAGLAKLLVVRTPTCRLDWLDMVETACVMTAEAFRTPAPIVDLATVDTTTETRHAVYPLVPLHQTSILYGDGGTGKSLLAMALALSVGGELLSDPGAPLLPHPIRPILRGPVLYVDYETCAEEQARQLQKVAMGHCAVVPTIQYRAAHRPLVEEVAHLRAVIQRLGIVFVVVDSMGPACGGRQEEAEAVIGFMNALRSLGPSVTCLVLSHVSKADGDRQRARIFGSVYARNLARSCWEVRGADESDAPLSDGTSQHMVGLYHEKVNQGPRHKPFGVHFTFAEHKIVLTARDLMQYPSLAAAAPLKDRVRQLMAEGTTSEHELSRQLDVKPARIRHAMEQLARACGLRKGGGSDSATA